ncbi:hypothetical protein NS228_28280 [Methylobacterium indicum]|uniref:hypothetical protein n=1 Tax=Methylobacterium indicum TaxID=1775910 RepID=UPI0007347995|nr:hypothetical protein [Methylobacterium indicum]KTS19500.1 hypothetical protein NS228_28280 [Methylobacterium indicum]KTS37038.1 hypothetical protein NS229_08630 [Methylobacterium indicum]KTS48018.1 hypothetical protein NS230_19745 [Methylobacterium indicum]
MSEGGQDEDRPGDASAPEGEVARGAGFAVAPGTAKRPGVLVAMPFDRALLARFKESFPTARWRRKLRRWFVPGTTAEQRADAWIAREISALDAYGDDKGRDAYAFEPLESRYLDAAPEALLVRTPYSRTVVDTLRTIPFAAWAPEIRAWRVPWRSYEALKAAWGAIEEAAAANEPEARRARREATRDPAAEAERRRRRHPVPRGDPPPLGAAVEAAGAGVVVFEALDDAPLAETEALAHYPAITAPGPLVWAWWRMPTFGELTETVPAAAADAPDRGWWPATRAGLEERRRRLRENTRARETRVKKDARAKRAVMQAGMDPGDP